MSGMLLLDECRLSERLAAAAAAVDIGIGMVFEVE